MGEFNDAGVVYCRYGATNRTVTSRWFQALQALHLAGRVNFQRTAALQAFTTYPLRPSLFEFTHATLCQPLELSATNFHLH